MNKLLKEYNKLTEMIKVYEDQESEVIESKRTLHSVLRYEKRKYIEKNALYKKGLKYTDSIGEVYTILYIELKIKGSALSMIYRLVNWSHQKEVLNITESQLTQDIKNNIFRVYNKSNAIPVAVTFKYASIITPYICVGITHRNKYLILKCSDKFQQGLFDNPVSFKLNHAVGLYKLCNTQRADKYCYVSVEAMYKNKNEFTKNIISYTEK